MTRFQALATHDFWLRLARQAESQVLSLQTHLLLIGSEAADTLWPETSILASPGRIQYLRECVARYKEKAAAVADLA